MTSKDKDFKIYFPWTMYLDQNISGFDLLVYIYTTMATYNMLCPSILITDMSIAYLIYNDVEVAAKNKKKVQESLEHIIPFRSKAVTKIKAGQYIIQSKEFKYIGEKFSCAKLSDLQKIISSEYNSKYEMLKLYICIMGSFDYRHISSNEKPYFTEMPQSWFSQLLGKNTYTTVSRYIENLEELSVLYVYRTSGQHGSNIMGHPKDMDNIVEYAVTHDKHEKRTKSNIARSMLTKYRWVLNGKQYSKKELEELRDFLIARNEELQKMQEKFPNVDYISNIKDIKPLDDLLDKTT